MSYSERFEEALLYAHRLHRDQVRKGAGTPYIHHLLAVASLVGEHGGAEEQVIAALLHDAVEDQGGQQTAEEIRRRFGERVLAIVEACTDTDVAPKPPWRPRKEAFLRQLETMAPEAMMVVVADKLHNVRSTATDLRTLGPSIWNRFSGGRDGTLWYYRGIVTILRTSWSHPLVEELDYAVSELERLAELTG